MDYCSTFLLIAMAVICMLMLLVRFNEPARYYAKFCTFTLTSLFAASIPIPFMLARPRDARNALFPAWVLRIVSRMLGMTCILRGKENIVQDTGCIVVINHQSALDLTVLAVLWPLMDRCTQIAKKSLFYLWPFGLACWLWGTIFIDRVNASQAQETINSTEIAIRHKKFKVLMFPEGTRGEGKELLPFKKGAFHVAVKAQCPIQPVVVSRYHFLDNRAKIFGEGRTIITILPAITTVGLTKDDVPQLIEQVRNSMVDCFNKTSEEAIVEDSDGNLKVKIKTN